MVDKHTLRKVYLEKRLFLSTQEYTFRNLQLQSQLFNHFDLSSYKSVHIFMSIDEKKEVLTAPIIEELKKRNRQVVINISKSLPDGELSHFEFASDTIIKKNKWGIPEPHNAKPSNLNTIDLVFIPLISFDKTGHRIGYGKGYYDRFLKKVPTAKKVGLALTPPLDLIHYSNEMDVKLDLCITPFKVYSF